MSDARESRPPRGLGRDLHTAREGAKASAAELREYVQQFRGKSPQEMMGLVAGSGLVQGTIVATVITFVFMTAFTVGPYLYKKSLPPPVAKTEAAKPAAAPAAGPTATISPTTQPASTSTAGTAAIPAARPASSPGAVPPDPVLDRLGIGESKPADPKKNPLEAGADDLLKDLK